MNSIVEPEIKWSPEQMIEIVLNEPDDFLKVRETLTRIGVASRKEKKLYQSCHILHKQGRYYIVHFKELFALDGKRANITVNDVQRRNRIIQLLLDWGLVSVVDTTKVTDIAPLNQIKVISYKEKGDWNLETKYNIGKRKKPEEDEMIIKTDKSDDFTSQGKKLISEYEGANLIEEEEEKPQLLNEKKELLND